MADANAAPSKTWNVRILEDIEQIETIRPIWKKIQAEESDPVINADIDRYLAVLRASAGVVRPIVLLLELNGEPKALLIGRHGDYQLPLRIGYKTLLKPKLKAVTVVYGGILGQPDEEMSLLLVKELKQLLLKPHTDLILFNHLRVKNSFYRVLAQQMPHLSPSDTAKLEPHWRLTIPDSIDDFFAARSRNYKKNYKRSFNKLQRDFPGAVALKTYRSTADLGEAIAAAAQIAKSTYKAGLGVGFKDNARNRALLSQAAQKDWFRGHVLFIDGEPAAFRFALQYRGVYFGDGIGFNPKYRAYNIGTISLVMIVEILCQKKSVDYYDFGFGDAEWKKSASDAVWFEAAEIHLFAPRFRPSLIKLFTALNLALTRALVGFLKKLHLYGRTKNLWRRYLKAVGANTRGF